MRPENVKMKKFLADHGIDARVKFIAEGSLKNCWRLYNPKQQWTTELAEQLNELGFLDYNGMQLSKFSGNGGLFSIFARFKGEI